MRWRNSVLFPVVFFPLLAVGAFTAALLFLSLSAASRPPLPWYGLLVIGFATPAMAFLFGLRLQRRLQTLKQFAVVAPQYEVPPSLPVWNEDEIGTLERELQQLVSHHARRERTLQSEGKKLEAVLQSMAEGVVVVDPIGNVVLCNRAAQALFGLSPLLDWRGKSILAFSRNPILSELLREVTNRRPGDQPITREMESEGKTRLHLAVSAMPVHGEGTTVSGYVLVFHDLTQLKRLESVRADFVANVSHELRTPLTAIKGYAETLLGGALKDPETATRFLSVIDRHSERLSRLIDDLLTLSDLELGKTELRREGIVLAELTEEVFEVVKDKAVRSQVRLSQQIPSEFPLLVGDGDRLQQALLNLIDNSIKYTPAGGTVTVTARTMQNAKLAVQGPQGIEEEVELEGDWGEVAVTDTGCGIPESEIPRLTQRFYRVDKARSRELGGTGLGLAIVKHIMQAHGGFLRIESQISQGTTVRLFLPLLASGAEDTPATSLLS